MRFTPNEKFRISVIYSHRARCNPNLEKCSPNDAFLFDFMEIYPEMQNFPRDFEFNMYILIVYYSSCIIFGTEKLIVRFKCEY